MGDARIDKRIILQKKHKELDVREARGHWDETLKVERGQARLKLEESIRGMAWKRQKSSEPRREMPIQKICMVS